MNISILISSYGDASWSRLAQERALPSTMKQGALEVIVEHDEQGTISSVRNAAASKANGEWLCFLDADDELGRGYIRAMQNAIPKSEEGRFLLTPAVSYVRKGRQFPAKFMKEIPLHQANWMVIGTLIERSFFEELEGFRDWPHGLEDWDLWSRAWKIGCKVKKVPRAIYIAHWNENSKHHKLMKKRYEHLYWYQKIGNLNWPEYFEEVTEREDRLQRLLGRKRYSVRLR